jgi:hypothetical protein
LTQDGKNDSVAGNQENGQRQHGKVAFGLFHESGSGFLALNFRKYTRETAEKKTGAATAWMIRAFSNDVIAIPMPIVAPHSAHPTNA